MARHLPGQGCPVGHSPMPTEVKEVCCAPQQVPRPTPGLRERTWWPEATPHTPENIKHFLRLYLFIRERERESTSRGEVQREREKQAPH